MNVLRVGVVTDEYLDSRAMMLVGRSRISMDRDDVLECPGELGCEAGESNRDLRSSTEGPRRLDGDTSVAMSVGGTKRGRSRRGVFDKIGGSSRVLKRLSVGVVRDPRTGLAETGLRSNAGRDEGPVIVGETEAGATTEPREQLPCRLWAEVLTGGGIEAPRWLGVCFCWVILGVAIVPRLGEGGGLRRVAFETNDGLCRAGFSARKHVSHVGFSARSR